MCVIAFPTRRRLAEDINARLRPQVFDLLDRFAAYMETKPGRFASDAEQKALIDVSDLVLGMGSIMLAASGWLDGNLDNGNATRIISRHKLVRMDLGAISNAAVLRFATEAVSLSATVEAARGRLLSAIALTEAG